MIELNYTYKAICTRVIDGDTFDCDVDLGFNMRAALRVRLSRINTPELRSPDPEVRALAQKALEFVHNEIFAKPIFIKTTKDDSFGRYLAEVYYGKDNTNLNSTLLEKGFAVPYARKAT